jgi:hypothetical protein
LTNHLDVLFHARVSNPSRVLAVSEVFALCEVAWDCALFFEWFLEESVANAELTQDAFIIDAGVSDHPETHIGHSMGKLFCKFLLSTWFVKPRKIDLHERSPVQVFFRRCWAVPWLDQNGLC